ncbi:hypothetical protein [Staphylococcus succinus]|uniref:hypothetical protein n=1 Tax=Staphylococcus succinus TaxID=61015 RepID=UPI001304FE3E|nr:hypothetical protein [Staphylococcus succinus]
MKEERMQAMEMALVLLVGERQGIELKPHQEDMLEEFLSDNFYKTEDEQND